jgi:hypothetical protein
MDATALPLKMKRLARWLDEKCQPEGFMQRQYDGPPFGECYVTVDPGRQGPAASFNRNRVHLCGTEPGLEPEGLDRLIELFAAAGVARFFVWLSPGPDMDTVRRWLGERQFYRKRWTGYPIEIEEQKEKSLSKSRGRPYRRPFFMSHVACNERHGFTGFPTHCRRLHAT